MTAGASGRARLLRLYLRSRRAPAALAVIAACAVLLRVALHWSWDAYGALQLPLIFEATSAAVIGVTTGSPFGEPERAAGQRLPVRRCSAARPARTRPTSPISASWPRRSRCTGA